MGAKKPHKDDGALCAYFDQDTSSRWFSDRSDHAKFAKEVCGVCPLEDQCLQYALENPREANYGRWGGLSQDELRRMRRRIKERASK